MYIANRFSVVAVEWDSSVLYYNGINGFCIGFYPLFVHANVVFEFAVCYPFSAIYAAKIDCNTAYFADSAVNSFVRHVCWAIDCSKRQICCYDQWFSCTLSCINHIEHLFKCVFCLPLHPEIIQNEQRVTHKITN